MEGTSEQDIQLTKNLLKKLFPKECEEFLNSLHDIFYNVKESNAEEKYHDLEESMKEFAKIVKKRYREGMRNSVSDMILGELYQDNKIDDDYFNKFSIETQQWLKQFYPKDSF